MDIQRRDDRFLEELGKLYSRKQMTLLQLDLFEYAYPHMGAVWGALRACLKGADE